MLLIKIFKHLVVATLVVGSMGIGGSMIAPAHSESTALISLQDDGTITYDNAAALQELLYRKYQFDKVTVLTNALPEELPGLIRRFLAEPGFAGDRRLIWVSGRAGSVSANPCPNADTSSVTPSVATVMIAPSCYTDLVEVKGIVHHLETAPSWTRLDVAPPPVSVPLKKGTFAFLSLPGIHASHVETADSMILKTFQLRDGGPISPSFLYEALRQGFDANGSSYKPTLSVFPARASWATNLIGGELGPEPKEFGFEGALPPIRTENIGTSKTRVFREPDLTTKPFMYLVDSENVKVIRQDLTGRMAFIQTQSGNYGWVLADALH